MFFHQPRIASMFFQQCKVLVWMAKVFVLVFAVASVTLAFLTTLTAQAGTLSPGYSMQSYNSVAPDGQFTAYNGQINYWTSTAGYQIYNTASGSTTTIGLPPNGTISNPYGDAFGVLDPVNNVFYAGTVAPDFSSYIYEYNRTAGTWSNSTSAGVHVAAAYGAQVYNGQLYVSGLVSGSGPPPTNIFAFGQTAIPNGPAPQTLIQASGYSADLAIAPNGDVYYGTNDTDTLYRWTAAQVAAVTSTPLTIANAQTVCTLPGGGGGLTVDSAGNVFFSVNDLNSGNSTLAIVNPSSPTGYDSIYTSSGFADYYGAISVDGNFLHGGTLYFDPGLDGGSTNSLVAIQAVPEPSSLVLLAVAAAFAVGPFCRKGLLGAGRSKVFRMI
jgi:hypothetical protein